MKSKCLKIIAITIILSFLLVGCGKSTGLETGIKELNSAEGSMFCIVSNEADFYVVYNKKTKVMYTISAGSYNFGNATLLVNADGTPMIYNEN